MNPASSAVPTSMMQITADKPFLPVVLAFVETIALASGLTKTEALKLTLASEELFLHLCRVVIPAKGMIEIRCFGRDYSVQIDFSFPMTPFNMEAFNLAVKPKPNKAIRFEDMRLLLASRSVNHFKIEQIQNRLHLQLIKDKEYPIQKPVTSPQTNLSDRIFTIQTPYSHEIAVLSARIQADFSNTPLPRFIRYPGRLTAMMRHGNCQALIARGQADEIGGGIFLRRINEKTIEIFGPYVINNDNPVPVVHALTEAAISAASRTTASVLICSPPDGLDVSNYFEVLGSIHWHLSSGQINYHSVWFRHIKEDLGRISWITPDIHDFLKQNYDRLALPREIRLISDTGDNPSVSSVFSSDIHRFYDLVTLRLIWMGNDLDENLLQHLQMFQKESIRHIVFEVDLGLSWQAHMIPVLLKNGFSPSILLPDAGKGDAVMFFRLQE
ncbi:MAG: hypothetical protein AB7S77_10755 [Desulfatirhabdiaceae bacterium]